MLFKTAYSRFCLITGLVFLSACDSDAPDPNAKLSDTCQLEEYEKLLWKPKSSLSGLYLPKGTRVIHPNQAVTMDYRTDRLNISIGKSNRIEKVFCG